MQGTRSTGPLAPVRVVARLGNRPALRVRGILRLRKSGWRPLRIREFRRKCCSPDLGPGDGLSIEFEPDKSQESRTTQLRNPRRATRTVRLCVHAESDPVDFAADSLRRSARENAPRNVDLRPIRLFSPCFRFVACSRHADLAGLLHGGSVTRPSKCSRPLAMRTSPPAGKQLGRTARRALNFASSPPPNRKETTMKRTALTALFGLFLTCVAAQAQD